MSHQWRFTEERTRGGLVQKDDGRHGQNACGHTQALALAARQATKVNTTWQEAAHLRPREVGAAEWLGRAKCGVAGGAIDERETWRRGNQAGGRCGGYQCLGVDEHQCTCPEGRSGHLCIEGGGDEWTLVYEGGGEEWTLMYEGGGALGRAQEGKSELSVSALAAPVISHPIGRVHEPGGSTAT